MIVEEGKEVKEVKDKERSSKMGRIPPHPAVFARVANKGLIPYGKWKSVRNLEVASDGWRAQEGRKI
jgi:hypothetical protein